MPKKDFSAAEMAVDEITAPEFDFCLLVHNPFENYVKGQRITEHTEIQTVIDKDRLSNCRKSPRI